MFLVNSLLLQNLRFYFKCVDAFVQEKKTAAIPKVFSNFFIKKKAVPETSNKLKSIRFLPFEVFTHLPSIIILFHSRYIDFCINWQVKECMRLADTHRVVLSSERLQYLDKCLQNHDQLPETVHLYLAEFKSTNYKVGHSENTWPFGNADDDDVISK